jgi:hypothetical protein
MLSCVSVPRSGSFSRDELTEYLLHACAICSKLGLAFLHSFHEVTFRKPTFCDSCSGFVSTSALLAPLNPSPWSVPVLTVELRESGLPGGWIEAPR